MESSRTRGVSPVVGVVLMVAIVVLLAAVVFAFATGLAQDGREPAPTVDAEADDFLAGCSGCDPDDQVVELRHESGDAVEMEHVEIVVDVEKNDKQSRLVDLPTGGGLSSSNIEGSELFDLRSFTVSGSLTSGGSDTDGEWQAGDELEFRIKKSGDGIDLDPGDEVTVRVVHTKTDSIVVEKTLEASD